VTATRAFDIAVVGGGPAGFVAALAAARHARVVLVTGRLPSETSPVRIETVALRTLALLTEFGLSPASLGVREFHKGGWSSWEQAQPEWQPHAGTAHIERPLLEQQLFQAVCAAGIPVIVERWPGAAGGTFVGTGWRASHLIDASGRNAVSAKHRDRPPRPWAGRFLWTPRHRTQASPEFRIAPLAAGYAYRAGSADRIGIGLVGRRELLSAPLGRLERLLTCEADWLLDGMPALSSLTMGATGVCSLQWSSGSSASLVGDASLARDVLSSQGLGCSLSDAFYAVAEIVQGRQGLLAQRHRENRAMHLKMLQETLARSRFGDRPLWRDYAGYLRALDAPRPARQQVLDHGGGRQQHTTDFPVKSP